MINLCKAERGEVVELGYLQGLTNLAQEDNGEVKFFTRLFPLGSTRNIDATKYGYSRLQLPSREIYVDKNVDLYGVKEETEETAFAEIYPQYVGTVSSVRTEDKTSEEGRKYTVYYFKDNGMNWNRRRRRFRIWTICYSSRLASWQDVELTVLSRLHGMKIHGSGKSSTCTLMKRLRFLEV